VAVDEAGKDVFAPRIHHAGALRQWLVRVAKDAQNLVAASHNPPVLPGIGPGAVNEGSPFNDKGWAPSSLLGLLSETDRDGQKKQYEEQRGRLLHDASSLSLKLVEMGYQPASDR
jgi:hypothetical protein